MDQDPTNDPSLPPMEAGDEDDFAWIDELPEDATSHDVLDIMVSKGLLTAGPGNRVYRIRSTSRQSAVGEEPLELSLRDGDDTKLTKRLIDYKVVTNPNVPEANVEIRIHHQRRANANAPWAAAPTFKLSQLQADHEVTLELTTTETLALFRHLRDLYAVAQEGIPSGRRAVRVVDDSAVAALLQQGKGQEVLAELLTQHGEKELIALLKKLSPNLSAAVLIHAIHETRLAALATFEEQMKAGKWKEPEWDPFFEANQWIFGHGLAYQFLQKIQDQPHYGGQDITGKGDQIGDYLMATGADIRFSVLVEVKRPDTLLLRKEAYRAGTHNVTEELSGGVAQLQTNCRNWAIRSATDEALRNVDVMSYEPKGILVIGSLQQFEGSEKEARSRSFHLFRRNLHNPEIITFDELLARARFLVKSAAEEATA